MKTAVRSQRSYLSKKQEGDYLEKKLAALTPGQRARVDKIANAIIAHNRANTVAWVILDSADKQQAIFASRQEARDYIAFYRDRKMTVKRAIVILTK